MIMSIICNDEGGGGNNGDFDDSSCVIIAKKQVSVQPASQPVASSTS
jgi:hypothetical protein